MTLTAGIRSGLRVGIRSGLNPSDGEVAPDPMLGVTQDATSGGYIPQDASEWDIATAGTAMEGQIASLYMMNGSVTARTDLVGVRSLQTTGGTSESPVTGWAALGWRGAENSGAPFAAWAMENPTLTSMIAFALIDFQLSVPVGPMALMSFPAAAAASMQEARLDVGRIGQPRSGTNTTNGAVAATGVQWVAFQLARGRSELALHIAGEVIKPTWTAPSSSTEGFLGGFANMTNVAYLSVAFFHGTAGAASQADVATVVARLNS